MTSPSSTAIATTVTDTGGDSASLQINPSGQSGISAIAAAGGTGSIEVQAGEVITGATGGSNTAAATVNGGGAQITLVTVTGGNSALGEIDVQPTFVGAVTNGGGTGETSVDHQIGVVNTTNRNGAPNDNYTKSSNNLISYYSGIGEFIDNNSSPPFATGTVNCQVPINTPSGATTAVVRLEIVLLVKCIVQSQSFLYTAFVGDYFLQKFFTTWVNVGGTLTLANLSTGTSPIDNFTGVATLDTAGTPFNNLGGTPNPSYKLGTTVVTTPGSGTTLLVQATPGTYRNSFGTLRTNSMGTSTCQLWVTAYYN